MTFANLARHGNPEDHPDVDDAVERELAKAGIGYIERTLNPRDEVPTTVQRAYAHGWWFERAWYYWRAHAASHEARIPLDAAESFHRQWGREVRSEGHCGCPSPRDYPGHDVGSYHIDTQEGLNAFVALLAGVPPAPKEDQ